MIETHKTTLYDLWQDCYNKILKKNGAFYAGKAKLEVCLR